MKRSLSLLVLLLMIPFGLTAVPKSKLEFKATAAKKNKKKIEDGIEKAVEDMSFITRPIARKKLKKSNTPFKKISIDYSGSKVSISNDGRKPVVSKADGSKTKWKRDDGEVFTVSQKVEENKITQVFYAKQGTKKLVYKFNDDFSKLWLSVRLDSPKLGAPLQYTMNYGK